MEAPMNQIRFVHTDHLRLAGSIAGLASAPDWLRRLARDATRGAVTRVFQIAATRNADFVFIGGSCTESEPFSSSVLQWLKEPIDTLRQQGIQVVMAASQFSEMENLADVVLHPDERLHATRAANDQLKLSSHSSDSHTISDLAISPSQTGASPHATCNYVFRPQIRHTIEISSKHYPVYSAGCPQSHGPHETGEFGCFVIDADPNTGQVNAELEYTAPLRFETRRITQESAISHQDACDAVFKESRALAGQQRHTTIVDWHIECPIECNDKLESWQQENILQSVRLSLQEGHLGAWPRRIVVDPSGIRLATIDKSEEIFELTKLLLKQQKESGQESHAAFTELVTGVRLLRAA